MSFIVRAEDVTVTGDALVIELSDGRSISGAACLAFTALYGTLERSHWRLTGGGTGIPWPELDEDVSVENLLAGRASGESQRSLERWLE